MARPKRPRRLGQRKAEKRKGLHLPLRRRVAGNRADQCRKHIADTDTGPNEGNARKAGSDHFGGKRDPCDFPGQWRWMASLR